MVCWVVFFEQTLLPDNNWTDTHMHAREVITKFYFQGDNTACEDSFVTLHLQFLEPTQITHYF